MIYKGGAEIHEGQLVGAGLNVGETAQCSTVVKLVATDTIEFYGFSPNANTKVYNGGGAATHSWATIQQLTQD